MILYPGQASILAIDPDIPDAVERVVFRAGGQGTGVAPGRPGAGVRMAQDYAWQPVHGAHELALVGPGGQVRARTRFQVRGK
ncbi:hypothetical protein LP419_06640 [Massilia sp. H-1]|nr:hypothetical protein LP419_06640 [Massilia sp. H-1]